MRRKKREKRFFQIVFPHRAPHCFKEGFPIANVGNANVGNDGEGRATLREIRFAHAELWA